MSGPYEGGRVAAPARGRRSRRDGSKKPRIARPEGWNRPPRRRVLSIRDRLRELYGRPANEPHGDPLHELVLTILSQNTNDRNRDLAYERLRERFAGSAALREAPVEEVIEAIRPAGLANQKGPRIQEVLRIVGEDDLLWLADAPREQALEFLTGLPGVGRKTAACVLIFSFGRSEIPVDTHVKRVGGRLGLFPESASFEVAHDEMLAITDPADAYELHMNLIAHGREICRPRPRCEACGLARMCPARPRFRARGS